MFIPNIHDPRICSIWYICALTSTSKCWDSDSRLKKKTRMRMCYFPIPATRKASERCCVNLTAWHAVCDMHDISFFSFTMHLEQQWGKMVTARKPPWTSAARFRKTRATNVSSILRLCRLADHVWGPSAFRGSTFWRCSSYLPYLPSLPVSSLWFLSSLSSPSSFSFPSLLSVLCLGWCHANAITWPY